MIVCFVFFFKQKTAYEMRISDWSSDVCSSDLEPTMADVAADVLEARAIALMREALELFDSGGGSDASAALQHALDIAERQRPMTEHDIFDSELADPILGTLALAPRGYHPRMGMRSEERRVGNVCVRPGRSRVSP